MLLESSTSGLCSAEFLRWCNKQHFCQRTAWRHHGTRFFGEKTEKYRNRVFTRSTCFEMSIVGKRRLPKFRFRWKRQLRWSNKMIDLNGWINLLNCQLFHLSSSLVSHALTLTIARTHAHAVLSVLATIWQPIYFFPKDKDPIWKWKEKNRTEHQNIFFFFFLPMPISFETWISCFLRIKELRSKSSYPSARISSSSSERINLDREKKPTL